MLLDTIGVWHNWERAELAHPFNTKRVKEKGKAGEAEEAASWKPSFSSFKDTPAGSAIAMAMARRAARPDR